MYNNVSRLFLGCLFCSLVIQSTAQINQVTSTKGFSPQTILDAQEKLKSLNKQASFKVLLSMSLFHMESHLLKVHNSESVQGSTDINDVIVKTLMADNNVNKIHEFEKFRTLSDEKAQKFFNAQPNANNTLLVNLTIGLRLYGYADNSRVQAYQHFSLFSGNNVPSEIKQDITDYLNKIKPLDFNDMTFKANDTELINLLNHLYTKMIPVDISYADAGEKSLDDNERSKCEELPSFRTQPVSGIPWKCIPADGSYVPINVTSIVLKPGSTLQFKLSNNADFKLRSPTLDSNSILWISCANKNKETAIIPSINGVDSEIQKINVIAYDKIVKEVAVVVIEEENDDIQLVPFEKKGLDPNTPVVSSGRNGFLDSRPAYGSSDDALRVDPATGDSIIVAGPDGICETMAENNNIVPLDIDREELERQLNSFYNPMMVEWKVHKTKYRKPINYDLNRDRLLDLTTYMKTPTGWQPIRSPEENLIATHGKIAGVTHHLFLVDRIPDSQGMVVLGRTTGTLESALIFTRDIENFIAASFLQEQMITTCAHELGHAAFKLQHPLNYKDSRNLMGNASVVLSETHLRKFQWDIMHGLAKP